MNRGISRENKLIGNAGAKTAEMSETADKYSRLGYWLKHFALRHIEILYYKGLFLSIGFLSFFQLFSLLPHFSFLIFYISGFSNFSAAPSINTDLHFSQKTQSPSKSIPVLELSGPPFHGYTLPGSFLHVPVDTVRSQPRSRFRK